MIEPAEMILVRQFKAFKIMQLVLGKQNLNPRRDDTGTGELPQFLRLRF